MAKFVNIITWSNVIITPFWCNDYAIIICVFANKAVNSSLLDKMAAISADDNFKCIFLNENERILIRISLKFVPRIPTDNKAALVQVMAWRRTGGKPLLERMLIMFADAYMRH